MRSRILTQLYPQISQKREQRNQILSQHNKKPPNQPIQTIDSQPIDSQPIDKAPVDKKNVDQELDDYINSLKSSIRQAPPRPRSKRTDGARERAERVKKDLSRKRPEKAEEQRKQMVDVVNSIGGDERVFQQRLTEARRQLRLLNSAKALYDTGEIKLEKKQKSSNIDESKTEPPNEPTIESSDLSD